MTKIKTNTFVLIIVILFTNFNTLANNDTLKRNAIYINPTKCLISDILGAGNLYIAGGYFYTINKYRFDIGGGGIVNHTPQSGFLYVNVEKMKGFFAAFELDRFLKNKFYVGVQLIYRYTESEDDFKYNKLIVKRSSSSIIPKFGFNHTNKKHFGVDVGFGLGIKYISSTNNNPTGNDQIEFPSGKNYSSGSGFYPAVLLLEIKLFKKI